MIRALACALLASILAAVPARSEDAPDAGLAAQVAALREEVAKLKARQDRWADWTVRVGGEFRARALVEANTKNAYVNKGGVPVYAYRPDSTLQNDYGWWDYRGQLRLDVAFRDRAELHTFVEVGNAAWGNQAPIFGGDEARSFGNTELAFRELYVEVGMDPIPLRMKFGRFRHPLGNRLIWGLENDGLDVYYRNRYVTAGFMGFRQYEGERYEMSVAMNDDEDTFIAYVDARPADGHALSVFGYLTLYEIPENTDNAPDPKSPLYNLPGWNPADYAHQSNALYTVGANWVADWSRVKLNLELDWQWGEVHPTSGRSDVPPIRFKGKAALAKLDVRTTDADILALTAGYGSGDDPKTADCEGFFAPDNEFGVRDDLPRDYVERGAFAVYGHLSPAAGVPGKLEEAQGTGGIENTIFGLVGYDLNSQANHHYYVGVGGIWAAEPNPETGSRDVGIEVDVSLDYRFGEHVTFRTYGGHLFMLGDYFRKNAYDAAAVYWEWKVSW
jgi:hypothetical protein